MFLLLFVTPWNTPQVQLSKLFKLWTTLGCNQQLAARTILLTARVKNRTSPLGNIIAYFCLQNASLGIYNKHITCTTSIVLTWCQFPYHQNWQKVASIFARISKQLKHKDLYMCFLVSDFQPVGANRTNAYISIHHTQGHAKPVKMSMCAAVFSKFSWLSLRQE